MMKGPLTGDLSESLLPFPYRRRLASLCRSSVYIYIYIYIYRERERDKCVCVNIHIYTWVYTYTYIYIYIYITLSLSMFSFWPFHLQRWQRPVCVRLHEPQGYTNRRDSERYIRSRRIRFKGQDRFAQAYRRIGPGVSSLLFQIAYHRRGTAGHLGLCECWKGDGETKNGRNLNSVQKLLQGRKRGLRHVVIITTNNNTNNNNINTNNNSNNSNTINNNANNTNKGIETNCLLPSRRPAADGPCARPTPIMILITIIIIIIIMWIITTNNHHERVYIYIYICVCFVRARTCEESPSGEGGCATGVAGAGCLSEAKSRMIPAQHCSQPSPDDWAA